MTAGWRVGASLAARLVSLAGALLVSALLATAQAAQAAPVAITDDRGVTVRLPAPPQRIVSLLPSLTETVCALGRCDRLVGVDRYSNHPASVRGLPTVGGGLDPQIETIVALRPDVVLAAVSARGIERLESLGLRVVALEPRTTAQARAALLALGGLLDAPRADRVWQAVEDGVAAAAAAQPSRVPPLRVYVEASAGGFAAGPSSFMGELMARLGWVNVVDAALGPFPRLNPEAVVRADPDLILIAERDAAGLAQRPGWAGMRAVREGHVCTFTPAQGDILVRPGPRMAEAAALMARCAAVRGTR